jgi:hypothetical protein
VLLVGLEQDSVPGVDDLDRAAAALVPLGPEARYEQTESISLAFLTAVDSVLAPPGDLVRHFAPTSGSGRGAAEAPDRTAGTELPEATSLSMALSMQGSRSIRG